MHKKTHRAHDPIDPPVDKVEAITDAIRKELKIDDPGMGIVFVMDVRSDYGLYKAK